MQPHDTTPSDVPLKRCSRCQQEKPLTFEYFPRKKTMKNGFDPMCKVCRAAVMRAYYTANKSRLNESSRAYYRANRERLAGNARAYRERNPQYQREYFRVYYAANRGYYAEKSRAYRIANKKRLAEMNLQYHRANPNISRASHQRRKARKLGAEGTHTAADIQKQYKAQKGACYWCGSKVRGNYHVDHIVPLSRGGTNWPENIVIACVGCNTSRGSKLPHEWPQGGRLL